VIYSYDEEDNLLVDTTHLVWLFIRSLGMAGGGLHYWFTANPVRFKWPSSVSHVGCTINMAAIASRKPIFTPKTHLRYTIPENFENATITATEKLECILEGVRVNHMARKRPFSKCFLFIQKRKADVFKFLRFEERF